MEVSTYIKYIAIFELIYSFSMPIVLIGSEVWTVVRDGLENVNGFRLGWFLFSLGLALVHIQGSLKLWNVQKLNNDREKLKEAETVFQLCLYVPDLILLYLKGGSSIIPVRKIITGLIYMYVDEIRVQIEEPRITFLKHTPGF